MRDVERRLARGDLDASAARAARGMAARAASAGLLDVAYATMESPFGVLLAAATPRGLVRLALDDEDFDGVLDDLAARISPRVLASPSALDTTRKQLEQYFAGRRRDFEMPLDWSLSRGFALRVRRATARIPYGRVSTYREIASAAGNARATRAAGNALGSNPIPVIVPCHRVLRTGGGLGGYGGGLEMKEKLLRLEGAL